MKQLITMVFCLIILTLSVFAGGNKDDNNTLNTSGNVVDNITAENNYNAALNKWKANNISNYYIKIKYSAFTPTAGIWEITVKNNIVVEWIVDSEENLAEHKSRITEITMEYLFNIAKESYNNTLDGMFLFNANYNANLGYVMEVQAINNIDANERPPTDRTFKYEVLEFEEL